MMNREIYQYELPWNALQLNSEDIYLSMGVGYVPDEEMLKQLDLLKKRLLFDVVHVAFMLFLKPVRQLKII